MDSNRSALSVTCLASGSSGNAILVRAGATTLLVDLGLPTRTASSYLVQRGVDPRELTAILLTHEHVDHASGVGSFSRRYRTEVVADPRTLDATESAFGRLGRRPVALGSSTTVGDCEVVSFPVSHDAAAPAGYLISYQGWSVAVCVDLGSPDQSLHDPLSLADLLILEANHDHDKLQYGPYTQSLKARILSHRGHLSNLEAARLIVGSATERRRTVWLAHLSAINNSPRLARRIVGGQLRREGISGTKLEVALRDRPSLAWSVETLGWQLPLLDAG